MNEDAIKVLLAGAAERNWRLIEFSMFAATYVRLHEVAGVITNMLPTAPEIVPLRKLGCPIVRIGHLEHPNDHEVPAVIQDFFEVGCLAAQHFIERGFKSLALLGHSKYAPLYRMHKGMVEVGSSSAPPTCRILTLKDMKWLHLLHEVSSRRSKHWLNTERWLLNLPKPVGLLVTDSWLAGCINFMCTHAGLKVPEEVAILAAENTVSMCELSFTPISAVDIPLTDRVNAAMEVLDGMLAGKRPPTQTYVKPKGIVIRRSSDMLAVENPVVAQAMRFMWDHLDRDLSVDDVAFAVKTPRHTLQRLFRKYLDRGIHEEMRRARLARFADLLRTTDYTVEQLAPLVGFRTAAYVTLAFREAYGITPRQYRLQASSESKM